MGLTSHCNGIGCPLRNDCYRYRQVAAPGVHTALCPAYKDGGCVNLSPLQPGDKLEATDE